ncbi:NAD(P)-dependent alcohol dehydrogenase [Kribbella sandramycini]|uniref:NAD(P)-dependent alcohol dehydrogenase n=1 Tax=Kribbella sandramycini TaxID=60450 RepID=A0A7Y4NZ29_9ACTN|nr:NAD(P)-dependent alcohol dehydrogenase [Kribbella sandramycini]MBB6567846.1 NADPH:quinone reductase-like Zn-dependent oxidoreductase [Kribbella sandramycini]NOL39559.1 NAD(P)-dependent alcohol dehydrogenase [Kribbella sandramycini]
MLAITQDRYGDSGVLALRDVEVPVPAADEVVVEVRAAGVDRGVWHLMTGLPYPVRLAGYGVRAPKNKVPGMDLAGVVSAVGADVTRFRPGDEVYGIGAGAFAEYARVLERKLAPMPKNLTFEQAAVVPISALTALQAVRDGAGVNVGDRVLIIGASGGVGSYAVQIAESYGAEVTGVCSGGKADIVRWLGAHQVLDYRTDDFTAYGPFDAILDINGNASLRRLRKALTPNGTLVIVGGENGGRWLGGNDRQLRAMLWSPFIGQRLRPFLNSENHIDLQAMTELIETGQVVPIIGRAFPLAEAADAIRYLTEGRARGKVVISVV